MANIQYFYPEKILTFVPASKICRIRKFARCCCEIYTLGFYRLD